jgi:hypothetical protein
MKKQASDQQAHERRYQQRKQAEAAKKLFKPKATPEASSPAPATAKKENTNQDKVREL